MGLFWENCEKEKGKPIVNETSIKLMMKAQQVWGLLVESNEYQSKSPRKNVIPHFP